MFWKPGVALFLKFINQLSGGEDWDMYYQDPQGGGEEWNQGGGWGEQQWGQDPNQQVIKFINYSYIIDYNVYLYNSYAYSTRQGVLFYHLII